MGAQPSSSLLDGSIIFHCDRAVEFWDIIHYHECVCVCVLPYAHEYVCIHLHAYMCVCTCVCLHVCVCERVCIACTHTCVWGGVVSRTLLCLGH